MPEQPPTWAVPRWTTHALRLVPALWSAVIAAYAVAAIAGDSVPSPLFTTVFLVLLSTATLALVILWVARRIELRLDTITAGLALVEDAPRSGLDPEVLDIGRRIARRLVPPET